MIIAVAAIVCLCSCKGKTSIAFPQSSYQVEVGKSIQVIPTVYNNFDETIDVLNYSDWVVVTDTDVIYFSRWTATGLEPGTTGLTATHTPTGLSCSCKIVVK